MTNALPTGNICPSCKIANTGVAARMPVRSDVLGSGTGNYGHGSVVRGNAGTGNNLSRRQAMVRMDAKEVKRAGNELYKRGQFVEALRLYDRAFLLCSDNAAYRSNRAAALTALKRLGEACGSAKRLSVLIPGSAGRTRGCPRCISGQVENARRHLFLAGPQPDIVESQKLQAVERHLARCADARKIGNWKSALKETDAAIASGADSSPPLVASRAEGLLRLHQLDADSALQDARKLQSSSPSCSETKFFGMISNSYIDTVQGQVEIALGRFENAVAMAENVARIKCEPRRSAFL